MALDSALTGSRGIHLFAAFLHVRHVSAGKGSQPGEWGTACSTSGEWSRICLRVWLRAAQSADAWREVGPTCELTEWQGWLPETWASVRWLAAGRGGDAWHAGRKLLRTTRGWLGPRLEEENGLLGPGNLGFISWVFIFF